VELNNWLYFREIQIDATNINMNLTDWLVAIKLDSNNFDFSKTQPSGADIRFTDSDGITLLDYWIEYYNVGKQKATIWVKVPLIPANHTKSIYMWYGNPGATNQSNVSIVSDPFNDNSCVAYYPFNGNTNDHSGNGHHGTWHGNGQYDDGLFGQCARFNGSSYINLHRELDPVIDGKEFTISLWVYLTQYTDNSGYNSMLMSKHYSNTYGSFILYGATFLISHNSVAAKFDKDEFPLNQWVHVVAIYDNGNVYLYNNNILKASNTGANIVTTSDNWIIGGFQTNSYYRIVNGLIDQVHVFNRALTESEILLLSQQLPYSIGDEIFRGSKLFGVVCDKYGIPIVDKPVKIFIFDKDSGKLYRKTTSDKGKWEADHLPVAENSKVLVVYTLEGDYREDNDLVGGKFSITQPL